MHARATITVRVVALVSVVVVAFLLMFVWVFYQYRESLYAEKREATRKTVEVAHSLVAHFAAQASGPSAISRDEAQRRALAALKQLRFDNDNYVWVNDLEPRMVMHPFKPELDGKDLSGNADPTGKRLFVEMAAVCKKQGEGVVEYMWPKPNHDAPQPKVSYVKLFSDWGWVIGSGIYVDDVEEALKAKTVALLIAVCVVLALVVGLGGYAMRGTLRMLTARVESLLNGSEQVASAAGEVAASAQSLAQGANDQAGSLREISTSLDSMKSITRTNAENAAQVATLMAGVDSQVQASNQMLSDMVTAMSSIEAASARVSKIIKTIDEIAFQTNILALNAAVEAARAGEAGAGFAVVADEVRNLAQRAAQAARDTSVLIEESVVSAQQGSERVQKVSAAIGAFTGSVSKVRDIAQAVQDASLEQRQGIDHVAQAVDAMEQVTTRNAAAAEESAAASEELTAQAETSRGYLDELSAVVGGDRGKTKAPASSTSRASRVIQLDRRDAVRRVS